MIENNCQNYTYTLFFMEISTTPLLTKKCMNILLIHVWRPNDNEIINMVFEDYDWKKRNNSLTLIIKFI